MTPDPKNLGRLRRDTDFIRRPPGTGPFENPKGREISPQTAAWLATRSGRRVIITKGRNFDRVRSMRLTQKMAEAELERARVLIVGPGFERVDGKLRIRIPDSVSGQSES